MKPIANRPMLITYADSLGGNLRALQGVLEQELAGAFGGLHILPFYPSSGDRGFAVIDYDSVDPRFGDWDDVRALGEHYFLMADFMLNHVSIRSREFLDYLARGDASPYRDMFIHWNEFWPNGEPTDSELQALYRRKEQGPVKEFTRDDGVVVRLWNTFFDDQVDIDPWVPATQEYFERNLGRLAEVVPLVRFDAFAYASKRPGTSCFFVEPEVWEILEIGMRPLVARGTEMLAEIHENYLVQLKMAERGHWVYDFALPMLVLHALFTGRTDRLKHWTDIAPRKQFTTLDTHDGIGVVDVVGLLDDDEIDLVSERVNAKVAEARQDVRAPGMIRRGRENPRQYQLMSSFYSALDEDDDAYLLARIVQLYAPGIPQVYYVGALFGENDLEMLKATGDPRGINRHDFTVEEVQDRVARPAIARLLEILRFRNTFPAFDGDLTVVDTEVDGELVFTWTAAEARTTLRANLLTRAYEITAAQGSEPERTAFTS